MRWLKIGLGVVVAGVALFGLAGAGGWMWAGSKVDAVLAATWETHEVDFPIPFPLSEAEIAELRETRRAELAARAVADAAAAPAEEQGKGKRKGKGKDDDALAAIAAEPDPLEGVDLGAIALERAQARGKHYTEAVFVCAGCHGSTFGGGKMLDEAPIGKWYAPNITSGGKTATYTAADWDRAVRHGVLPGGATSIMPIGDFAQLTDHELSDIIAYIRSVPPQQGGETIRELGPIGRMLMATGKMTPEVYNVADHHAAHTVEPPPAGETVEFGKHVTSVCVGCHRTDLRGGPMPFGPPDWPPAGNLTPHESGLAGYTYEDFERAFVKGVKKDGTPMKAPMTEMLPATAKWTETELKAAYLYLQSLPPTPIGE